MAEQLALAVQVRDDATFDNFVAGANQQAVAWLASLPSHAYEPCTFLWGAKGVGKSHLLHAVCHAYQATGARCVYLPLGAPDVFTAVLDGLENLNLVCLDNLQAIAGIPAWEEAIFHLYNRMLAQPSHALVLAADQPFKSLGIQLNDLYSRISWGVNFQIMPLSEDDVIQALCHRANLRGLEMSDEVARFLIRRYERSMRTLNVVLETLDKASLQAQRRLTIPFVKTTLGI